MAVLTKAIRRSGSCGRAPGHAPDRGGAAPARGLILVLALAALPASARAQVFMTQEEALRTAFPPPAVVERRTAYLTEQQLAEAQRLAGRSTKVEQNVVSYYVARKGDQALGAAYFDAHRVRTLPEVLMVVIGPDDRVTRVEVLKFTEPPEYLAPGGWLAQFEGRALTPSLSTKGDIVNITGATLTSSAVTEAVRRVLALHGVLRPFDGGGR